ncbi:UxaA family hydrolase [Saezia sanguinis]|nr:UxaA family hydrolase [Saezia sanguinis]
MATSEKSISQALSKGDSAMKELLKEQSAKAALILHPTDNVAVVVADIDKGDECIIRRVDGSEYAVQAQNDVKFGHKIALADIAKDAPVIKYGEEIGRMEVAIKKGDWIHNHNMCCSRGM